MSNAKNLATFLQSGGSIAGDANFDSNTLFVDASANRVGIGTNSPSTALDVTGTITSDGLTLDNNGLIIFNDPQATDTILIGTNDDELVIRADAGDIVLKTNNNSTSAVVDASGNVGIGNSSAQTRLFVGDGSGTEGITIYSGTTGEGQLRFADGTSGSALYQGRVEYNHSTNKLFLGAGGTTPVAIDSSGNVGIGTNSPHDSGTSFTVLNLNGTKGGSLAFSRGTNSATKQWAIRTSDDEDLRFEYGSTLASEAMRIDSSGNLLVGKTSSDLTTTGSEVQDGAMRIVASSTSTNLATNSGASLLLGNPSSTNGNFSNIGSYNTNQLVDSQINFIHESHSSRTGAIGFSTHDGSVLSERMRITNNGITFNGDTAAANALDDYEEGSWTPASPDGTITVTGTPTYIKIGKMVFVQADITMFTSSSGTQAKVDGLPFAVDGNGTNSQYNLSPGEHTYGSYITMPAIPTTDRILFRPNGGTSTSYSGVSGKRFRFSGWYETT